jgi:hypothetical protein
MARALSTVDPRYLASSDAIPVAFATEVSSLLPRLGIDTRLTRSKQVIPSLYRLSKILHCLVRQIRFRLCSHVSLSPALGRKLTICFLDQLPILPRQPLILLRIHSFKHLLDVLIPLPFETAILRLGSLRSS